jgi:hypothetical protein
MSRSPWVGGRRALNHRRDRANVRFRGKPGRTMLRLSISQFNPERKSGINHDIVARRPPETRAAIGFDFWILKHECYAIQAGWPDIMPRPPVVLETISSRPMSVAADRFPLFFRLSAKPPQYLLVRPQIFMQDFLKYTNDHLCFGKMGLICFDDLCRSFVRSGLLPSIDHVHATKFSSVGNRSPKPTLKVHAFLHDKVDQIMGRREFSIGRANAQADTIIAYSNNTWPIRCPLYI